MTKKHSGKKHSRKKHSGSSRKKRSFIASLIYLLAVFVIVCCLGFLYEQNQKNKAEHKAQQTLLMEEEKVSDTFGRTE